MENERRNDKGEELFQERLARCPKDLMILDKIMVTYFDVDGTLLLDADSPLNDVDTLWIEGDRGSLKRKAHIEHCELLKALYKQGIGIVVWSKGGARWATAAVVALGLEQYVDAILSKPQWLVDDQIPEKYLPSTTFINPAKHVEKKVQG